MDINNTLTAPIGAINNQPVDTNTLSTHRFKLLVDRIPSLMYFAQEVTLPGITTEAAIMKTPFVDLPFGGDKLIYEDLQINFAVDVLMSNYKQTAAWITGLTFPKQHQQYANLQPQNGGKGNFSDLSLLILDNEFQAIHTVVFRDAFPTILSGLKFVTTNNDSQWLVASVTFKYAYWELDEVNADLPEE